MRVSTSLVIRVIPTENMRHRHACSDMTRSPGLLLVKLNKDMVPVGLSYLSVGYQWHSHSGEEVSILFKINIHFSHNQGFHSKVVPTRILSIHSARHLHTDNHNYFFDLIRKGFIFSASLRFH